jgi:ABC-type bacteriocin/lantibiotic exporter with double-glycine peptidase domain
MSADLRRALAYLRPYKAQLGLILLLSAINTALSLSLPYLTKTLVDSALVERNLQALYITVSLFAFASAAGFALTAIVGLRYTTV